MRIATSNIPPDTLHKILLNQIDPQNPEHYKKIARFYIQAERYKEAEAVLNALLKAFPDRKDLAEQLAPSLRQIKQLSAARLVRELKLRRDAGQHRFVWGLLPKFPSEGVGGDILQGVREMIRDYEIRLARYEEIIKQLKALAARMQDTIAKENLKPIIDEIEAEIGGGHARTAGRFHAERRRPENARQREDRPGHQRLAVGRRLGHGETARGDLRLQGPQPDSRLHERNLAARAGTDVRLHQAGAGRQAGDRG